MTFHGQRLGQKQNAPWTKYGRKTISLFLGIFVDGLPHKYASTVWSLVYHLCE